MSRSSELDLETQQKELGTFKQFASDFREALPEIPEERLEVLFQVLNEIVT